MSDHLVSALVETDIDLGMLRQAIEAGDPKAELLERIEIMKRAIRNALFAEPAREVAERGQ